jgi:hypothetical protein
MYHARRTVTQLLFLRARPAAGEILAGRTRLRAGELAGSAIRVLLTGSLRRRAPGNAHSGASPGGRRNKTSDTRPDGRRVAYLNTL